jgi:hypothetical protein
MEFTQKIRHSRLRYGIILFKDPLVTNEGIMFNYKKGDFTEHLILHLNKIFLEKAINQ